MRMLRTWKSELCTHEDLIIERYDWLLNWSMRLTGYDRQEAEDLVQDAFVEFTLTAPDLRSIQNVEAYLYGMLKNLHLSRVRRAASRLARHSISLLEYDSAEIWLRSVDPDSFIQTRELLRRVCNYACIRKETSKSGSILILRFFHGYYPGEIARVALCNRRAVDDWMLIARKEANPHVERPSAQGVEPSLCSSGDFLDSLSRAIFRSNKGACLAEPNLRRLYSANPPQTIDRKTLAHIVSCPVCLEQVNNILHIPPLSDRFPTDTLGPDTGLPRHAMSRAAAKETLIKAGRRLARSVYEHEPRQLNIAVNGFLVASETVANGLYERMLALAPTEKPSIVEAFSEQGVRLLGLNVQPPPEGEVGQYSRVDLSEGRFLELSIGFEGLCPMVKTRYDDPRPAPDARRGTAESSRPAAARAPLEPAEWRKAVPRRSPIRKIVDKLLPWIRPATVTAAVSIILAFVIIALEMRTPPVRAAELLKLAVAAGERASAQPDVIFHQKVLLEERRVGSVVLTARHQLDIWANPRSRSSACRVYDENGQLIAGEWVNSDGQHSVYRRGAAGSFQTQPDITVASFVDSGDIWRVGLSAKAFQALVDHPGARSGEAGSGSVEQRDGSFTVHYDLGKAGKLAQASLVLNKPALRPLEQILVIRRTDGLVEYRFTERSSEGIPLQQAKPSLFYPDPWILESGSGSPLPNRHFDEPQPSSEAAGLSNPAIYELKLDAIYKLHEIGACLGGQALFTTTVDGKLRVQLWTESEKRRSDLTKALAFLAHNPNVQLDVTTFNEAAGKNPVPPADNGVVRRIEVYRDRIPLYNDLKNYFEAGADGKRFAAGDRTEDEKIEAFAAQVLKHSRQSLLHAWALRRHAGEGEGNPSPEQSSLLNAMTIDHLEAIRDETGRLEAELKPVFFPAADDSLRDQGGDSAMADTSVDRLYDMISANDQAVRSGFSLSSNNRASLSLIKSRQFWDSLKTAEAMAARMAGNAR
jgi:RNA polymerase sigma factor (sigma-70 family)